MGRRKKGWEKFLKAADWERYKERVEEAVRHAVQKFRQEHPDEPVFTISILTDPQAQWTCVSFDTKEHSLECIRKETQYWREKGRKDVVRGLEEQGFNANPADFKYYRFYEVYHPELASLRGLDFSDAEQDKAAFEWVEKHLEEVVEKLVKEGVFTFENREEVIRIGINSPYDWFDKTWEI